MTENMQTTGENSATILLESLHGTVDNLVIELNQNIRDGLLCA